MKKIFKLLPFLFLFLACEQGVIFHDIALEIELEEPNVIGNVNSIVRLGNNLYTQNGNIYRKPLKSVRGWTKITAPGRVIALASNESDLYALTAEQVDDDGYIHDYQVYALVSGGGNWVEVSGASIEVNSETDKTSMVALFDNGVIGDNAGSTGRNAYIRIEGVVKQVTGSTMGATVSGSGVSTTTIAAARALGVDYFSNTRSFCSDDTLLYSIRDGKVKTSTTNADDSWKDSGVSISDDTMLIFADDILLAGTLTGLQQVSLDSTTKEPTSTSDLPSNAEATTGEKEISAIGYFSTFDNEAIYAGAYEQYSTSITSGLWGYYPSRGNWNFE